MTILVLWPRAAAGSSPRLVNVHVVFRLVCMAEWRARHLFDVRKAYNGVVCFTIFL